MSYRSDAEKNPAYRPHASLSHVPTFIYLGVMPKACFPEAFSCESSMRMNAILKTKLREFARDIHALIDKVGPEDDAAVKALIKDQMKTVYRIVSICLGTPPQRFTWEYTSKTKKYQKVEDVSPLEFYNQHVRSAFDCSQKVIPSRVISSDTKISRFKTNLCL